MSQRVAVLFACFFALVGIACAQANGKLQIHHMDVGQGDGAVLISPAGEVVVFDAGEDMKRKDCTPCLLLGPTRSKAHRLPLCEPLPF
jgi:hypothetical protein